ncbi:GNAT family N-acetyltransferase [Nocardioides sp.]|uniref:GNAT family N-acetyltransferase n=1 Tax=Nocardioides sp. TaxID=35761 RepID=UPI0039E4CD29
MLWRVRTTLPDKPGALAGLAHRCGEAGVNILALQIFPGAEDVVDEIVMRTPVDWTEADVVGLLEVAGGGEVVARTCTEAALTDQPTRYVEAARAILARPMSFPEVVAGLFDAEAEPVDGEIHDVMEMTVGDVQVQVHRTTAFTATEHARGAAMAGLVNDVLDRSQRSAAVVSNASARRLGSGATPTYVVDTDAVSAYIDDAVVGVATVLDASVNEDGDTVRDVDLNVDPAWQRRGIGTRLLMDAARIAHALGADEILLTTRPDNQAVLPMVLAAGLRGRIRMAADQLTVRVPVRDLKPLAP